MKTNSILYFLIFLTLDLASCSGPEKEEPITEVADTTGIIRLTPSQLQSIQLQTGSFQQMPMSAQVKATGMLDVPPQNLISLTARVSGFVKSTRLLQGLHVHKGDVLLVLENPEFIQWQETWLSNQSRLIFLEKEWERQESLADQKAASQKNAQQSESEFKSLKASQLGLESKLKMLGFSLEEIKNGRLKTELPVLAPSDGYITSVYINTGQFVQTGAAMADLVDRSHLHVELLVYEQDLGRISEGQQVRFLVHGMEKDTMRGKVFLINPRIGADRTVQVHVHIEGNSNQLVPNMQVQAWIETGSVLCWAVPEASVVSIEEKQGVFREVEKGAYRFEPFQPGITNKGWVEWRGNVSRMHQSWPIVTRGAFEIKGASENKEEAE